MKQEAILGMTILVLMVFVTGVSASPLMAGFARVDITPEPGCEMPGGFNKNFAKEVHDPLFAEAAVLFSPETALAVVGVDALMIPDDVIAEARRLAEAQCGIPALHILIAASHTHNGGPVIDCLGSESDPAYQQLLAEGVARAVAEAHEGAVAARLSAGSGHEDTVAFNRRFRMKDGTVRTHPGKMNPDIAEVEGPIDPEVAVIAVESVEGELLGCIVNYALHGTVIGGAQLSADWPGYMRRTIRAGLEQDIGVVFLNGACGDVTQVDNRSDGPREFGEAWAKRVGQIVGGEVLKVLARSVFSDEVPLDVTVETIELPIRDLAESDEALVARETPASGLGSAQHEAYLREAALVRARKAVSPLVPVEVQAMRIGNAAIVTNPTEFFCALGLAIKEASPWQPTMVSELSNGYAGYAPTAAAFEGGGYEIRTARSSFLAPGASEQIVGVSVRTLHRLQE
jgi:neutral ceramidase